MGQGHLRWVFFWICSRSAGYWVVWDYWNDYEAKQTYTVLYQLLHSVLGTPKLAATSVALCAGCGAGGLHCGVNQAARQAVLQLIVYRDRVL